MAGSVKKPQEIYDHLWSEASLALERGQPDIDPFLSDRENDFRRGITLAFRPSPAVRSRVKEFLREAAQAAPDQHIYQLDELHTTVLSVIPGSATWRNHLPELPAMRAIISDVFQNRNKFSVVFRGVTASPGVVMIQGFPVDNALAQLRDYLRAAFKRNNIGADIDRRYKIATAHITAMRFSTPLADWSRLLAVLNANRTTDFGETRVETIELLFGDWYASADSVRILEKYQLK